MDVPFFTLLLIFTSVLIGSASLLILTRFFNYTIPKLFLNRLSNLISLVSSKANKSSPKPSETTKIENDILLSMLVHDLAAPITGIMYRLRSIRKKVYTIDKSIIDLDTEVSKIDSNIASINEVINLVKQFHALQLRKVTPNLVATQLHTLILESLSLNETRINEKRITFSIKYENSSHETSILTDPILFKNQILNNLISNAVKFSLIGKTIYITIKQLGNNVILEIKDTGIGIPKQILPHVFEMSSETTRPGTENEIGTGLGLPLVKYILDQLGGQIEITSIEAKSDGSNSQEQGTTIRMTLKRPTW